MQGDGERTVRVRRTTTTTTTSVTAAPKPFVKWAGGKRQLLPVLERNLPPGFGTYHEPFLGGGAMLFRILSLHPDQRCAVSDLNPDLILVYTTVRDRVDDLISSLEAHAKGYAGDPAAYYYSVRAVDPGGRIERASRLIFLNRTCFNGLYRVNSRGGFNVPHGRYKNPQIVGEDNLRAVSRILRSCKVDISHRDFSSIPDGVSEGDLVYLDPPYLPVSDTAKFTSYTDRDFGYADLVRLARLCADLDGRGARVMLSNSDSEAVSNLFPEGWRKQRIAAKRFINSDAKKRTGHHELLITNY